MPLLMLVSDDLVNMIHHFRGNGMANLRGCQWTVDSEAPHESCDTSVQGEPNWRRAAANAVSPIECYGRAKKCSSIDKLCLISLSVSKLTPACKSHRSIARVGAKWSKPIPNRRLGPP